jgi:hypothetical protein
MRSPASLYGGRYGVLAEARTCSAWHLHDRLNETVMEMLDWAFSSIR